jgi:hypothetical protein
LELNRTQQPVLEFWYAHDNSNPEREDQMDVRLTYDGGTTYATLFNIMRYDSTATSPLWKKYMVDLSPYQDSACTIISFEGYSYGGEQHIDRISVSAKQDVSVSESFIASYSACDLAAKELKVVITNETGQNINFDEDKNKTELVIEVTYEGALISSNAHPLTGLLTGLSTLEITDFPKINLAKGMYIVTAYITPSIDNTPENDVRRDTFVINPALSVQVERISGGSSNCIAGESQVWQQVTITNTGNIDLSDIGLILQIDTGETGSFLYAVIRDTCTDMMLTGSDITYTFKTSYSAPWTANYYAAVTAYLLCDSSLTNGKDEIMECVDVKDLYIVSIDNPAGSGQADNVGSSVQVIATIVNRSDGDIFDDLPLTYRVTNSQGIETATFTEKQTIGVSATVNHTFTTPYSVPDDTVYYLSVYIDNQDNYRSNDTMTIRRETDVTGIKTGEGIAGFTLSQNIPNPTAGVTRIDYSIPETGGVIFQICSISGQLLYSEALEVISGKHSLEVNTTVFAAGVYFYLIEYRGQRLVKRMVVH